MIVRMIPRSHPCWSQRSFAREGTRLDRIQVDYGESQIADEEVQTRRGQAEFKIGPSPICVRVCLSIQLASPSRERCFSTGGG